MSWIAELSRRIRMVFRRRQLDLDLQEEMRLHLELRELQQIDSGLSPDAARLATYRRFGNSTRIRERSLMTWGSERIEGALQDFAYGIRALLRSPALTAVALLSLALGIGANTAIFSLINAILLRPLPVLNPQQLVLFGEGKEIGSTGSLPNRSWQLFSYPFYRQVSQRTDVFSGVAAISSVGLSARTSIDRASPEETRISLVSGSYFPVLGVGPAIGRTLSSIDDGAPGSGPVAVASYSWFQHHFAGNPAALGKSIRIHSHTYTLVGVAQPGFFGTTVGDSTDLWIPLSMEKEISPGWNGLDDKLFQSLYLIGRLKPGVTTQQATSSTNLLFQQILRSDYLGSNPSQEELNTIRHASIDLTSASHGLSSLRQRFSPPLKILMVIVGLVLLIACANIANMLLARGVVRAREIAVRMALGASRRRIILQLLTESAVLALAGATIGIALAWKAGPLLLRLATPGPNPVPLNLSPDLRVLGFALLITISTALLFGVIPALRATRLQLSPALKDGRGATAAPHRSRLQRSLIVGQIALSILLLTAASLFLRSLMNLTSINTGFDSKNVLVFSLDELAANLKADSNLVRLQQQIESRVKALPAVQADSFSMFTFDQGQWSDTISLPDSGSIAQTKQNVLFNVIGDDFFSTVGLPLQVGRPFSGHDTEATPAVAIINETMQRHFFPNQYAIGHHFGIGGEPSHGNDFEIIGVVKDAKYVNLGESQQMAAYFPYSQRVQYFSNFAVRYTGDKTPVVTAVRQTLAEINPAILVRHVSTLEDQVNGSIATPRLIAQLSAFFGLVAVFLSSIGIYGLISYSVLRRTSEIGIRLALGARTTSLLWMVLREAALLLSIGILVGVPVALLSTRILRKLLYQLSPNDPWALVLAVVAVAAMALLAAWLPARRASRVDPIIALRCE